MRIRVGQLEDGAVEAMILRWLARKMHLLPNGELLQLERAEAEQQRVVEQQRRTERISKAARLKEKIAQGEENVPLDLDAFMRAAGIDVGQRRDADARGRGQDDREY